MSVYFPDDAPVSQPPAASGSRPGSSVDIDAILGGALAGGYNSASQESVVKRSGWINPSPRSAEEARAMYSSSGRSLTPAALQYRQRKQKTSAMTDYNAEFFDRWRDPNFQTWLGSRMAALGVKDRSAEGAYQFWVTVGEKVSSPSGGRSPSGFDGTPEQYIEYMANGGRFVQLDEVEASIASGDMVLDPITGEAVDPFAAEQAANPIQTQTSKSFVTINPLAANAAVDDLSRALLGRMATEKEMARLRKAMNKYLAASPTITNTTVDSTDPDNIQTSTTTKDGASASDAQAAVEMRMRRSSEGQAFNAGKMFEDAFRMMG